MKTIYSILFASLNTALNEKISIGLLMSDGYNTIFKFSSEKLLAVKAATESERYGFIKNYLKALDDEILKSNNNIGLFTNKIFKVDWVTDNYLNYLSNYSNNLIQFSEPKFIDISFSTENFKRIFKKYVHVKYDSDEVLISTDDINKRVKERLYSTIDNRVNLDVSLNSSHFENLFTPIEINFIGMNGIPVVGQTVDFSKKHYNLENDIARFVSLTKAIELHDKKKGKYFILGHEPEGKEDKNHVLWSQIKNSDFLDFVDIDAIGIVEEYIEHFDVKPYFEKNAS